MPIDVDAAVTALARMTVTQLRHRYGEVFGEPARSFNKQHLVKRIAWRKQANAREPSTKRESNTPDAASTPAVPGAAAAIATPAACPQSAAPADAGR